MCHELARRRNRRTADGSTTGLSNDVANTLTVGQVRAPVESFTMVGRTVDGGTEDATRVPEASDAVVGASRSTTHAGRSATVTRSDRSRNSSSVAVTHARTVSFVVSMSAHGALWSS